MKIVSTLISYTKDILRLIRLILLLKTEITSIWTYTIFWGWHRSKCNIFSLDLFKTYAIFLQWDRQCSWWFYIFEQERQIWWRFFVSDQVTSFWHQDKQVSRQFYELEQDMQFLLGGCFAFSGSPMKKQIVPIDAACFSWPETTKIWNSPKINWAKILQRQGYVVCTLQRQSMADPRL